MAIDKVQLKQETVVDNEVVLEDINPISSTKSINDPNNGSTLDQTLEKMWNAINNKLSRVVNSVNGRTGVVVLNASDVGLGNVDNVSFADIKQWVINKLIEEFGNKRIKLFENLNEVDQLISTNDMIYRDTAFFASHTNDSDKKSCIGYIWLDEGTNKLTFTYKQINTVGYTDNSIIYDEKVNDNDLRGGGIGVNIYKYEDALKLYNSESGRKDESGLYIDKSKIAGKLYHFDGMYGDGTIDDVNALLYYDTSSTPSDAKGVKIFVDDRQVVFGFKLRKTDLRIGDLILCDFKDYRINGTVPSGMSSDMMLRNPCIGRVVDAPSDEDESRDFQIYFYSIKPYVGWGLQYMKNHQTGITDDELSLQLANGYTEGFENAGNNISGLQVYCDEDHPSNSDASKTTTLYNPARYTSLPQGSTKVFMDNDSPHRGLFISPDMSLCVMPEYCYAERCQTDDPHVSKTKKIIVDETPEAETGTYKVHELKGVVRPLGSKMVDNWAITSSRYTNYTESVNNAPAEHDVPSEGVQEDSCLIGINLMKTIRNNVPESLAEGNRMQFSNISGLRINRSINKELVNDDSIRRRYWSLDSKWFGMTDQELDKYRDVYGDDDGMKGIRNSMVSGGLSVNVGKFLEIEPGGYNDDTDTYYDGGKINVRIGNGLEEEPPSTTDYTTSGNRIQVKVGGSLTYNDDGGVEVNNGKGLTKDDEGRLTVNLNYSSSMDYYTSGISMVKSSFSDEHFLSLNIAGTGIHGAYNSFPSTNEASISLYGTNVGTREDHSDDEWQGIIVVHKKQLITFKDNNTGVSYTYDPMAGMKTEEVETGITIQIGNGLKLTQSSYNSSLYTLELDT